MIDLPLGAVLTADALVRNMAETLQGPWGVMSGGRYYGRFRNKHVADFAFAILQSYERLNAKLEQERIEYRAKVLSDLNLLARRRTEREQINRRVMAHFYEGSLPYLPDEVHGVRRNTYAEEMLKTYSKLNVWRRMMQEDMIRLMTCKVVLGILPPELRMPKVPILFKRSDDKRDSLALALASLNMPHHFYNEASLMGELEWNYTQDPTGYSITRGGKPMIAALLGPGRVGCFSSQEGIQFARAMQKNYSALAARREAQYESELVRLSAYRTLEELVQGTYGQK